MANEKLQKTGRLIPGPREFVALMAFMASLLALAIDAMLPALGDIGRSLAAGGNQPQLVISVIFLGSALGQLVSGAISDSLGRRPIVFVFIGIFLLGTVVCAAATEFWQIIVGRVMQGFGAAGPQIVSLAIIRDRYEGRQMARITSFVMSVFILVPIIAPLLGQGVLLVAEWRTIFALLALVSVMVLVWFAVRQPETLPASARTPISVWGLARAAKTALSERSLLVYTIVQGLVLGAFIGYLSSTQQIFQEIYGKGAMFPVYFALLSVFIGSAGAINGTLVIRLGMHRLSAMAFITLMTISAVFFIWSKLQAGQMPFLVTLAWLGATVFCVGIVFGNVSALALEPLGGQAGMGATLFGGVSTLIALPVGLAIGQSFDGTVSPLALGFAIASAAALAIMYGGHRSAIRA